MVKTFKRYLQDLLRYSHYHTPKSAIHFVHIVHSYVSGIKPVVKEEENKKKEITEEVSNDWLSHNENHELGKTSADVSKVLKKYRPKFSNGQRVNVAHYTQESGDLNRSLITKHLHKTPIEDHHRPVIKDLDKLTKNPIGQSLHVYSGIGFNPAEHIKDHEGVKKLHLPAYTSVTHDKETAHNFSEQNLNQHDKHILHIHMKPEDRGFHVGELSSWVAKPQHETILPRNTKLHIHSSEKSGDTHIWHATIHSGKD
jgi:hypothetical protein